MQIDLYLLHTEHLCHCFIVENYLVLACTVIETDFRVLNTLHIARVSARAGRSPLANLCLGYILLALLHLTIACCCTRSRCCTSSCCCSRIICRLFRLGLLNFV